MKNKKRRLFSYKDALLSWYDNNNNERISRNRFKSTYILAITIWSALIPGNENNEINEWTDIYAI